jgi:Ca2+-transporting ATPase
MITGDFPGPTTGLTSAEAAGRLRAEGPNALPARKERGLLAIAVEVIREPMLLLLVSGAGIYLLLGDAHEALVLGAAVMAVIAITIIQERRSERALEALRDLASPRARVVRDGTDARIPGAEVVRGDLLLLAEGDRIPADARLLSSNELLVDESLLTGESLPVSKSAGAAGGEGQVYSGTLVVKGQARAEATATGARSELGRIGVSLAIVESEKTHLEIETARIVRYAATAAVMLSLVVSVIYLAMRGGLLDAVLAGLTLAMAILPEEFPVVLTVFLALGAWRISQRGVLTRRMPAIEMLGAATVLCVDKTGTLTENRMALVEAHAAGQWFRLAEPAQPAPPAVQDAIGLAALASELEPFDPMERAIVAAARQAASDAVVMRGQWELARDYPLTPHFAAVCHGWQSASGERLVAIKGAPETVLALCGMNAQAQQDALDRAGHAAERGFRLLAVAQAGWEPGAPWPDSPQAFAFRWAGFVALADPLRASVPAAVAQCRRAGIRVVMITGDYAGTALSIAAQAGLETGAGALTGAQLERMGDAELADAVRRVNIFARIRPEQKLRLVAAYKADNEVVAMTGDGVNDAPALKAAHIGVAMGKRGTDVAREASSLVLLNDDFGDLVGTVRLGRRIYTNIRNAMAYLVSVHVPIAGMAFLPLLFGWPLLLYPVHVAFLEFVIDPACSIVFEAEHSDEQVMDRPPRDPAQPLFNLRMLGLSLLLGATSLIAVAAAYLWASQAGRSDAEIRALGFATIVLGNLFMILAYRRAEGALDHLWFRPTRALYVIVCGAVAALALAIYVPAAARIFGFAPLRASDLGMAVLAAAAGVIWFVLLRAWHSHAARKHSAAIS